MKKGLNTGTEARDTTECATNVLSLDQGAEEVKQTDGVIALNAIATKEKMPPPEVKTGKAAKEYETNELYHKRKEKSNG